MQKLLKSYEKHMETFLKTIVKTPKKINNYKINSMTTRQELLANSSNQIIDKKGFSFKNFKTDKERIKAYTQNKEDNVSNNKKKKKLKLNLKKIFLDEKRDNKYKEDIKNIFKIFNKNHEDLNDEEKILYEQFKHKYDKLFLNNDNDDSFDEINNQNGNINSLLYGKKDILKIINNTSIKEEDKYKKLLHNKIYNERKNMLLFKKLKSKYINKIKKLNKTNSNLFTKTNFKAMENLTLFKSPIIKHKINKTLSSKEIKSKESYNKKNIFNKTMPKFNRRIKNYDENNFRKYSIDINLEDINNYNNKSNLKIFTSKNILNDIPLRKEIFGINPLLFQYNVNYIKNLNNNINNKDHSFNDKIISLKKMAFETKQNENEFKYENNFYDKMKKNDFILIDGEEINKNDLDKIADRLLKKCNWKPDIKLMKRK